LIRDRIGENSEVVTKGIILINNFIRFGRGGRGRFGGERPRNDEAPTGEQTEEK
jgi:hypothetical protein